MIYVNEPALNGKEMEYVAECIRTGWVSSAGKFITDFEEKWAHFCNRKYGVAVSNGTVALQLAVAAIDLNAGDEVIIPTFTIISCALAVIYNGGIPVLVDCDPQTWCMNVSQIEAKITSRTKAIMAVHIYGHPVDMDSILKLAEKYKLTVIEDAAEAHGAGYLSGRGSSHASWRLCGSFGTISCFSFYANKLVTTGEGGMVLTDDAILAERFRSMRNLCFLSNPRFLHYELGHNFRMTNIQAALGVAQLERFEHIVERKRWMGNEYLKRLSGLKGIHLPIEHVWAKNVYWMFGIVIDESVGLNAKEFAERLLKSGIETRPFFLGMHEQPVFHKRGLFINERYPVAEKIAQQGLYLPSGLTLSEEQIVEVVHAVKQVIDKEEG